MKASLVPDLELLQRGAGNARHRHPSDVCCGGTVRVSGYQVQVLPHRQAEHRHPFPYVCKPTLRAKYDMRAQNIYNVNICSVTTPLGVLAAYSMVNKACRSTAITTLVRNRGSTVHI
jgi:hypothetical protein